MGIKKKSFQFKLFVTQFALCIIFLFLFIAPAYTQKYEYKQYTTADGLPINNVYCAAQDGDGFMWFGTDFGIVKFDGNQFYHYYTNQGMENKAVTSMVYAGGDSLVFISYPDAVQAIHTNGRISTLFNKKFTAFQYVVMNNNCYYFGKRNGNAVGKFENNTFSQEFSDSIFSTPKTLTTSNVIVLNNNKLAYSTNNGLFIKDALGMVNILPNTNINCAIKIANNHILIATNKELVTLNENYKIVDIAPLPPKAKSIIYMAQDAYGTIWFRDANKGVYTYANKIVKDISKQLGFENKIVHSFFKDAQNNFWICTSSEGILLIKATQITNLTADDGLVNNKIQNLLWHNNRLWLGTENGLSYFKNNSFTTLKLQKAPDRLDLVTQLQTTYNNYLGVNMNNAYVNQNKYFLDRVYDQTNIRFFKSRSAWQKDENLVYLNSGYGSYQKLNVKNNSLEDISLSPIKARKAYRFFPYKNQIWVATDRGIIIEQPDNSLTYLDTINNEKLGEVFDFLIDHDSTLWIATEKGLFLYKNNQFVTWPKANGFGANYCKSIIEDDENTIWVATWDGLMKIKNAITTRYSNGFCSNVINDIIYNPTDQKYYLGTENGLSIFTKSFFDTSIVLPKVFINASYLNNAIKINIATNYEIGSTAKDISFNFSTPYYKGLGQIMYQYKLDQNDWVNTQNPTVIFNSLSGGKHILQVRYMLQSQGSISEITTFNFTKTIPFYKKWWFVILSILAAQFLLFYLWHKRNSNKAKKEINNLQKLNEQASLKQQAFAALLNPHFIFNSLNSIQHFINKQDRPNANKYLSHFASLIRRNFEDAQKQFVPLEAEIENLRLYLQLEKMRFGDKINYHIQVADNIDLDDWMLPTLMLQPFLENALLHGLMPMPTSGQILILFNQAISETNHTNLIITIADNGIGIQKSKALQQHTKHNSKGMHLIKERMAILSKVTKTNITLTITNNTNTEPNPGTKVVISYPLAVYDTYVRINNL